MDTTTDPTRPPGTAVVDPCMLICMQEWTSVRIDTTTHETLKRLAGHLDTTIGHTVKLAVRGLQQEIMGKQLASRPLSEEEIAWLDADLG